MDWIHCNNCFTQFQPGVTLHLTSCGHMFCNNCLEKNQQQVLQTEELRLIAELLPRNGECWFGKILVFESEMGRLIIGFGCLGCPKTHGGKPPGAKDATCLVCQMTCSLMKLVPDMKPEIQEYFTDPEELVRKSCEVLQFQRQHRRRLLSYLLQSTKKFHTARTELKRLSEICQTQHKQLKEYQKIIRNLEAQLKGQTKQVSPFSISPGSNNISPNFLQCTPTYKRPAKSTPFSGYQSNLVTPSRISRQRSATYSMTSQRSNTSNKISSTVFTPPTPESIGYTSFVKEL